MHKNLIIGCGYLGRVVAKQWRQLGCHVFGTVRSEQNALQLKRDGIEPIVYDVLQPDSLAKLPNADVVLYCVGFDRSSGQSMRDVYVQGLQNVAARLDQSSTWISVSSTSVYGQDDGSFVNENADTNPQEESGKVVLEAEQILQLLRPDAVVLRFAGIYGPGRLLRRRGIENGEPIVANAERWLNLIHVADGASAVVHAEEHCQRGETYNVSDGNPLVRREFYIELARILNAPAPKFETPDPNQPSPPHEKANRRVVNTKLCATGWQPRFADFRVGLRDAAGG